MTTYNKFNRLNIDSLPLGFERDKYNESTKRCKC